MQGIGNISNCDGDCSCDGCDHCDDGKRPEYIILTIADMVNVERYAATTCDEECLDADPACQVQFPVENFNGSHQLNFVSVERDAGTGNCGYIYRAAGFDAGDFYIGPLFCQDCVPPFSATDVLGNPLWIYDLQYGFEAAIEAHDDLIDMTIYALDDNGDRAHILYEGLDLPKAWFCAPSTSQSLGTIAAGATSPISPLYNDDGNFFIFASPGPEGEYVINERDIECGSAPGNASLSIESSVGRTAA